MSRLIDSYFQKKGGGDVASGGDSEEKQEKRKRSGAGEVREDVEKKAKPRNDSPSSTSKLASPSSACSMTSAVSTSMSPEQRNRAERNKQLAEERRERLTRFRDGEFDLSLLLHDEGWRRVLLNEFTKPYMRKLTRFLAAEQAQKRVVFPPFELAFNALNLCRWQDIKVVLLGQDPYHGPGQAMGMAFSVPRGVTVPPSLRNMYKELQTDVAGFQPPSHGDLSGWSRQGVLLLNTCLTVRRGTPASHAKQGWEQFTDAIIRHVSAEADQPTVFFLWGNHAKKKKAIITNQSRHLILESGHPSPLSVRYFQGCKHFSKANQFLESKGRPTINWSSLE